MKPLFISLLLFVIWAPLGCSEKTIYRPVIVRDTVLVEPPESCADVCWKQCKSAKEPDDCLEDCLKERCMDRTTRKLPRGK